jgi:hypothetical protein
VEEFEGLVVVPTPLSSHLFEICNKTVTDDMSDAASLIDVQIIDGRGYVWNADGTWRRAGD